MFIAGLLIGIVSICCVFLLLGKALPGANSARSYNLRKMVEVQSVLGGRIADDALSSGPREELIKSVRESQVKRHADSRLTLQKRLKYAQWRITPFVFHLFEVLSGLVVLTLVAPHVNFLLQLIALLSGPIALRWLLTMAVDRRFRRFDGDYPQFLLSVVGLLKTGMAPVGALEAAAKGLDRGSLVRHEVELMIDRLRMGVSEDRSIGCFGEDIFHPEIELFVQALLLSRRVGGNLSHTLERLAKQVRKRQYFRSSANAAVGLQRGSIMMILLILVTVEVIIGYMHPDLITVALNSEVGWQVWQTCLVLIFLGVFWVRQVTKIKI